MKNTTLCFLAILLVVSSCKKDSSSPNPDPGTNPNPPVTNQPTATFGSSRYGTADLWSLIASSTIYAVTIQGADANTGFTYEITGSNGMKAAADTTVKGTAQTDVSGKANISTNRLGRYKDGTLTIKVHFNNTAGTNIEATTKKEEFIIRNYRDLMGINSVNYSGSSSDTYVQAQDIAFPDTTLTAAVIYNPFYGTYDGQGYKITNVTIVPLSHSNTTTDLLGVFGNITRNSTVKNIKLELSSTGINTPNEGYCGGIAGVNMGSIFNCSVKGAIKAGGTSTIGGITGQTRSGRLIGSSFNGTLNGFLTGGLSGLADSAYVNMCYGSYSVTATDGGGLIGNYYTHSDGLSHDTVYNCYAYIKQATVTKLYSLFYTYDPAVVPYIYANCYSNAGIAQTNTISYSTAQDLNASITTLQVGNLPAGISAPPSNKPFKSTSDLSQPPLLWWE